MNEIKLTSQFDRLADFVLFEGDILDLLTQVPITTFPLNMLN